ncbi:NBS-LRR disease resistance protein [Trifolium medium]|uniref:NBS-LRR disease resistance protein n=1 Tax=Trifolium medium TaxID=97028 RepID=A0A392P6C4_9FABA|nr:NBS-LRR disease resistance protein [Trifolium medium]
MFRCLSKLTIIHCLKIGLPCLPSLKDLSVEGCNDKLLLSISNFCCLTRLCLDNRRTYLPIPSRMLNRITSKTPFQSRITSFPEGMFTNLTFLQTLSIWNFPKLKELPNQPFNLALERLDFFHCDELESLPGQIWESLQSLRFLGIRYCKGMRCLPEGIRHLTSLEILDIIGCPTLEKRCKEGTGEDWDKIAHIPKIYNYSWI